MNSISRFLPLLMACLAPCWATRSHAQWSTDPTVNSPVVTAINNQRAPATTSDGAGGVIVAWDDYRDLDEDIYAQRIDAAGVVLWTSDGVTVSDHGSEESDPVLVSDGAGGAIVVWHTRFTGGWFDIYAQRVDPAGAIQWFEVPEKGDPIPRISISLAAQDQENPRVVSDGAGGAIIAWEDTRDDPSSSVNDVYVQRVNGSGVAGTPDSRIRDFNCKGAGLTGMGGTICERHHLERRSVCDDRGCRGPHLCDRNHGLVHGRARLDHDQVQLGR